MRNCHLKSSTTLDKHERNVINEWVKWTSNYSGLSRRNTTWTSSTTTYSSSQSENGCSWVEWSICLSILIVSEYIVVGFIYIYGGSHRCKYLEDVFGSASWKNDLGRLCKMYRHYLMKSYIFIHEMDLTCLLSDNLYQFSYHLYTEFCII